MTGQGVGAAAVPGDVLAAPVGAGEAGAASGPAGPGGHGTAGAMEGGGARLWPGEASASAAAAPVLAELSAMDLGHRAAILRDGGGLASAMRSVERRRWPSRSPGWLAEVWRWVLWLRISRGLAAATTCARYAEIVGRFAEWVGSRGLDYTALTLSDLDDWAKALVLERRNSASWRRTQLQALRSFYGWRKSRGLGPDVTAGQSGPRRAARAPRKYSRAELKALFAAAKEAKTPLIALRNRTLLLFLLTTGARRSEAAGFRLDQVLELGERSGVVRFFGKGAKEREVAIEGPIVRMLHEWLTERGKLASLDETVFVRLDNPTLCAAMSTESIEDVVSRAAKRAGLASWGVHRFRVTFATRLYDAGVDIERVRILMGHEDINTTRRYIQVSGKMRSIRLKAHEQHDVLGTRPEGMPLWAQRLEEQGHGGR